MLPSAAVKSNCIIIWHCSQVENPNVCERDSSDPRLSSLQKILTPQLLAGQTVRAIKRSPACALSFLFASIVFLFTSRSTPPLTTGCSRERRRRQSLFLLVTKRIWGSISSCSLLKKENKRENDKIGFIRICIRDYDEQWEWVGAVYFARLFSRRNADRGNSRAACAFGKCARVQKQAQPATADSRLYP